MQFHHKISLKTYLTDILVQNAPVIYTLKPASIFTVQNESLPALIRLFQHSEISLYPLFSDSGRTTLLFYRDTALQSYLRTPACTDLLLSYGYCSSSLRTSLQRLRQRFQDFRLKRSAFPHELGLFLGYPIWDVLGFIKHNGKNELYTSHWKVYDHLEEALQLFSRFDQAMKNIEIQIAQGTPLRQLIMFCSQSQLLTLSSSETSASIAV